MNNQHMILFADQMYYGTYYEWIKDYYRYGSEQTTGKTKTVNGEKYIEIKSMDNKKRKAKNTWLICSCGYEGVAEKKGYVTEWIDGKYKTRELMPKQAHRVERIYYQCPICKQLPQTVFPSVSKKEQYVIMNEKITEKKEEIKLSWSVCCYLNQKEREKKHKKISIIYRFHEKKIIIEKEENQKTVQMDLNPSIMELLKEEWYLWHYATEQQQHLLYHFLQECYKKSQIQYRSFEEITGNEPLKFDAFEQFVPYLEIQTLENLPDLNWFYIPFDLKEQLKSVSPEQKVMWKTLIGHESKKVRKSLHHPTIAKEVLMWGPIIKNVDYLQKIMQWIPFKKTFKSERLYEGEIAQKKQKAILWFKELHENEEHFFQVLQKFPSVYIEDRLYLIHYEKMVQYMVDSHQMYHEIKQKQPNYELNYKNNLTILYQYLKRDFRRMKKEKVIFDYTEKEKGLEMELESYHFKLPIDNRELIKVGNDLDICISLYTKRILKKKSTLLFVLDQHQKVILCLEIKDDKKRGKFLKQVKQPYNLFPTENQKKMVIHWCKEKNIDWKCCEDLQKENEFEKIK